LPRLATQHGIGQIHDLLQGVSPERTLDDRPVSESRPGDSRGRMVNVQTQRQHVTGDFSRGASGLWIQNGELTFPVEEIAVAGNLKDMLFNISEISNTWSSAARHCLAQSSH
jgi:PmbA/TldA metallopeptidase C-terminal domain